MIAISDGRVSQSKCFNQREGTAFCERKGGCGSCRWISLLQQEVHNERITCLIASVCFSFLDACTFSEEMLGYE